MFHPHRVGALALVLLFTLAACSSPAPSAGSATTAPTGAPTQGATPAPQRDELILAIGGESEDGYDPTLGWGRYGSPLFQSTLLRRDSGEPAANRRPLGRAAKAGFWEASALACGVLMR